MTTGATIDERVRTLRVIGVHPLHHGLRVTARARRHLRGAALVSDVVERQSALTRPRMGCAHGQLPQILRGLAPTGAVNT